MGAPPLGYALKRECASVLTVGHKEADSGARRSRDSSASEAAINRGASQLALANGMLRWVAALPFG